MNRPAAMESALSIELDATDQAIIGLLREDGRMPYRSIARVLGLTEPTVRARVRRMEESNTLRLVAVTDVEAAGFGMLLAVGVTVENRSPDEVARDLAAIPEVFSVNVVVGARNLNQLLGETLASIPGVRRLTPALAVDVLKNQPNWVPFHDA